MASGIDFSDLFSQASRGYVNRPDVERAVTGAVQDDPPGCVVVVGEPGSGKTALAAQMILANGWCCHFLRIGHTEFTLWQDPYAFLTSVAFQLQAKFGDALFPEAVAIDVNGQIHDVSQTGSVVGVDIDRLIAVPWRRERVRVDLDARRIAGDVTGVQIKELVENYRSVPLLAFRDLAWVEPLRRLREIHPEKRVVLWIDGLDEEVMASGRENGKAAGALHKRIGDILPLGSECRALGNVSVVISARRGPHLDRFLADGAQLIELDAQELLPETSRVLGAVIERELQDPAVGKALAKLEWPEPEVRDDLVEHSEGNFLYVRQYFEAVRAGLGATLREGGLPRGLDDIHARILGAMIRDLSEERRKDLLRLMQILTVAQVPVTAKHLGRFAGLSADAVKEALQVLRPLLDEPGGEQPQRFSWYHKSLRDCFLSPQHSAELWQVDAPTAHAVIANAYFDPESADSSLDGYGVLYGPTHLAFAGPTELGMLFNLLHDGWRRVSRDLLGSNRVFHQAVGLAGSRARTLPPAEACSRLIQLALTDVYVFEAERQIPADALEIMVLLGDTQRALDSMPEGLEPVEFARRNAAIIRGLVRSTSGEATLATKLVVQAVERLKQRPDWLGFEVKEMLDNWPLEKASALREIFPEIEATAVRASERDPGVLAACARVRTVLEPATANAHLQEAFDAVNASQPSNVGEILGRLLSAWAGFDPAAALAHIFARGSFQLDEYSAAGFVKVSVALEKTGKTGSLAGCANTLLGLPETPDRDPLKNAAIWIELVRQAPGAWAIESAAQIVDRVRAVSGEVRAARVAEGKSAIPADDEISVLTAIAECEPSCARGREEEALSEAWQPVLMGGLIDERDLARLVHLQIVSNSELLEAYLNSGGESLRDRASLAVLRGDMLHASAGSEQALDRILKASEKPRATGWSFFYFGLARICPPDKRDECEQLLGDVGERTAPGIVSWRLKMLANRAGTEDIADWLRGTIKLWTEPRINANFVDELPAVVSEMPEALLTVAEDAVGEIQSRNQRRLLRAAIAHGRAAGNPAQAEALFDLACDEPVEGPDAADIDEYVMLAFIAGQMWPADAERASGLWENALNLLEARLPSATANGRGRYLHLCGMLRALHWGAPEVAIPKLSVLREPRPGPGERHFVKPFPWVSPYRVANLSESEYLLGCALARAGGKYSQLILDTLSEPLPPGGRSFSWSMLAQQATSFSLAQRLDWCQKAEAAAAEVEYHPLQCLLRAESAKAFLAVGVRTRAQETAKQAAAEIARHAETSDTIIVHAYAAALGRCVAVAIRCEAWDAAWTWLWQGRRLGMHGCYVMLAEVPEAMQAVAPVSFDGFLQAVAQGGNFYV